MKTRAMIRPLLLFVALFATWLLLSGHYTPLITGLGVVSCAAVAYIAHRMDVVDREGHPIHLGWHVFVYMPWLLLEIIKANLDVARIILHPRLPISPRIVTVKTSQRSELGQVIYANSITLTPGTVSLRIYDDNIDVHAISAEAAAALGAGDMDRRVSRVDAAHEAAPGGKDGQ